MSQIALFLITDEKTVVDACQGWVPPLDRPRTKQHTNPFTGEVSQVKTLVSAELDDLADPTIEEIKTGLKLEARDRLAKAQPLCVEFKVHSRVSDILRNARPFLYGDVHGAVHEIKRIAPDDEAAILQYFSDEAGPLVDERERRGRNLSIFVYIYSS